MRRSAPDSSFDPLAALTETEGLVRLARTLGARGARAVSTGHWGASGAFLVAALARRLQRPVLIVAATSEDADRFESDLRAFASGEGGCEILPFPAYDVLPTESETPEMPVLSARLATLGRLAAADAKYPVLAVAPVAAVLQPVPEPGAMEESELRLRVGDDVGYDSLLTWLHERGMERVPEVGGRGEFSVRGGVIDIFPLYAGDMFMEEGDERPHELPVRVELFGDTIESLRTFEPFTQRSIAQIAEFRVPGIERSLALDPYTFGRPGRLAAHLGDGAMAVVIEPGDVSTTAALLEASESREACGWPEFLACLGHRPVLEISRARGPEEVEPGEHEFPFEVRSVQRVAGRGGEAARRLAELASRLAALSFYCRDDIEEVRLKEILGRSEFEPPPYMAVTRGHISAGFEMPGLRWAALADHDVLSVTADHRRVRARPAGEAISDFLDLSAGDYVVHHTHGIARYLGLTPIEKPGGAEDFMTLLFADNVRLYVPAAHAYLVERFVGAGEKRPALSKVGSRAWRTKTERAAKAARDIAADLLATQAARERAAGIAHPADTEYQAEFESAFPYEETGDQLAAVETIKIDMERPAPMDRLLCGDVGFGKTEVALRAAFKAVMAGRQVAVLVPTTLLAEQHHATFERRLEGFPVTVGSVSRFRTGRQMAELTEELSLGRIDIMIGTHRLLSDDVRFRDLGLIVIDEEQRFGVEHKEKLKRLRLSADVLTLTATPIPRTLHMSLVGLRDISNLAIPPEDRLSIRTKVCRFSEELIRRAVLREMARGGQVYFVHDRVMDIDALAGRLAAIVPEARITVAHGQMSEKDLSTRMKIFLGRLSDVLVSTTIIESGIDIPSANTIFINNADHFGLAELHQLRGRVGRYRHQAYAYLMLPGDRAVSTDAEKRLRAIEEFDELGAGFKLAMRDLEIRGAGNLLGAQQSGHIAEIGYELYCRLLERAVRELRGETVTDQFDVTLALGWGASLPTDYIPDEAPRLEIYRKLAAAREDDDVREVSEEIRDRFGPLPEPAERVLAEARIRLHAQRAGIPYVGREFDGSRARLDFKLRTPEFMRIERALKGLRGSFTVTGPESFAVHHTSRELRDDALEERISRLLDRLRVRPD